MEEGQLDIESHGQSPEEISRHEPVKLCQFRLKALRSDISRCVFDSRRRE